PHLVVLSSHSHPRLSTLVPYTTLFRSAGFALTGLGASVVMPIGFSAAGRLDPEGSGTAVARVNVSNYVGFVLGAVLIGTIAEALDLRAAFAAPTVLLLGAVLLARSFDPPRPGAGPAGSAGPAAEPARG